MHYCTDPLFQKELYAFHMRSPQNEIHNSQFIIHNFIYLRNDGTNPVVLYYMCCMDAFHYEKKDSFHQEIVLSAIMNYDL